MKVWHDDEEFELLPTGQVQEPEENESTSLLELKGADGEYIYIRIPTYSADTKLAWQCNYILDVCKSNDWQDGDFSRIKYKASGESSQKAVGYIFPLPTLSIGKTITETEKEVASGYALGAIFNLTKGTIGQKQRVTVSWGETYDLEEFYEDETIVVIYGSDRLSEHSEEAKSLVREFKISLAEAKIFPHDIGTLKPRKNTDLFVKEEDIYVAGVPKELRDNCFKFLISHVLPADATDCDPIVRFFLQYQFFEILMHHVFTGVVQDFLKVVNTPMFASDAWKTKDLVGDLGRKSAESYRIKRIFDFLSASHRDLVADVERACEAVLAKAGKKDSEKTGYYLIRNLIFHGFGNGTIDRADIESVCDPVERIIHKLALNFKHSGDYFSTPA
ncbi:hypothetical protein [Pseudomonas putida]